MSDISYVLGKIEIPVRDALIEAKMWEERFFKMEYENDNLKMDIYELVKENKKLRRELNALRKSKNKSRV